MKKKIFAALLIIAVLVIAYIYGDPTYKLKKNSDNSDSTIQSIQSSEQNDNTEAHSIPDAFEKSTLSSAEKNETAASLDTDTEDAVEKIETFDTENSEKPNTDEIKIDEKEEKLTCTLSVRCDTILENMSDFPEEKRFLVPADGVIYYKANVEFNDGESVFDILLREMKTNNIHIEFVDTPIYKSTYIEGINNIYEFDCGEFSGWMYRVNNGFPRYGSSSYIVSKNDVIEFVYTCALGIDVGDNYLE